MEEQRSYLQRGTPDCPIDVYGSTAGPYHQRFTHWHPELELMIVEEGTTTYRMNKEYVTLRVGDIMVIPPGTIHGQQASTPVARIWSMVIAPEAITMPDSHVFQKEFVEPMTQGRLIMPTVLHPGDPIHTALLPHMSQLSRCKIYTEDYKLRRFVVAVAICVALRPFCRLADTVNTTQIQSHRAVNECMRYIHRHYMENLTVDSLARHVHLQPNYLCALFKEHTGQTVMEHLTQIRVDAATFLLRNSDLPIGRVGELSGFRSESVFFTRFKALTGLTPKGYRKQRNQQPPDNSSDAL